MHTRTHFINSFTQTALVHCLSVCIVSLSSVLQYIYLTSSILYWFYIRMKHTCSLTHSHCSFIQSVSRSMFSYLTEWNTPAHAKKITHTHIISNKKQSFTCFIYTNSLHAALHCIVLYCLNFITASKPISFSSSLHLYVMLNYLILLPSGTLGEVWYTYIIKPKKHASCYYYTLYMYNIFLAVTDATPSAFFPRSLLRCSILATVKMYMFRLNHNRKSN